MGSPLVEIRSVVVGRKPVHHGAGQSIYFSISFLKYVGGVLPEAVELGKLYLWIPAQHSLKSSLHTGPTGRIKQDINPTWDGPQKNPSLLGGGIRSLSLVRIFFAQCLRFAGLG